MAIEVRPLESVAAEIHRHLFTVSDFQRMGEVGILHEDSRVELIGGEIVQMPPIGDLHASTVARISNWLMRLLPSNAIAWIQNPIVLDNLSEPEPDICILRGRTDFYRSGKPGPGDVLLLIEISDSSLAYDRDVKKRLYANAQVSEYWIVNLLDGTLEVNLAPRDGVFSRQLILTRGESISTQALPDRVLAVDDILGPADIVDTTS